MNISHSKILTSEKIPQKIWLHGELEIYGSNNNYLVSSIVSKIYQCNIYQLILCEQNLTLNEFKALILSENIIDMYIYETLINEKNGDVLTMIELFEMVPKIEKFGYKVIPGENGVSTIPSDTAEKLLKILQFFNLTKIFLSQLPETFDFEAFFNGLKAIHNINIILNFSQIVSNDYKYRLNLFINQTADLGLTQNFPPLIGYGGIELSIMLKLLIIREDYKRLHGFPH